VGHESVEKILLMERMLRHVLGKRWWGRRRRRKKVVWSVVAGAIYVAKVGQLVRPH
jgi:hypothetical protein